MTQQGSDRIELLQRVACGQSSVLVFEWEWCAIDKDLELA